MDQVGGERSERWGLTLVAMVVAGIAVRAAYILVVLDDVPAGADAIWYQLQGGAISEGVGFVVPRTLFADEQLPTAAFPPAYPAYQGIWHLLVGPTPSTEVVRLAGLVPAALTIWLTALLGRRVAGQRVGLLAGGLVALHPGLIAADGSAMSESLTVPLTLGVQVLALRLAAAVGVRERALLALGLGAVVGLAVLTRQDLVLLGVLLAGWLVVAMPGSVRVRLGVAAMVTVVAVAVVAPWAWRNHRTLDVLAVSTLSPASAVAGANCDGTYAGPDLGSWDYRCVVAARPSQATEEELLLLDISEAELVEAYQQASLDHLRANPTRVPVVVAAREARAWSWWSPRDLARRDAEESRRYGWQLVVRPLEAAIAAVGAVGIGALLRRRAPGAFVLLAPVLVVIASVAVSYGNPRFAVIAQPSLLVAGAWLVWSRWASSPAPVDEAEVPFAHASQPGR
jgi:hypothetical protein